jgi:hypothetical protein
MPLGGSRPTAFSESEGNGGVAFGHGGKLGRQFDAENIPERRPRANG